MADGTSQAEYNIPYREVKGFPGLGVRVLRFPCQVPDCARCKHCNCIPKRIYPLLCSRHVLCLDCKKDCNGYFCDECRVDTTPEQLGAIRPDFNLQGILQQVLCDVCHNILLLGQLEEHLCEHTNQGRMECSKVQETTNQHEDVSQRPMRVSYAVSGRCHFCNENVRNNDYVEHVKMHTEERNNQGDSIVQETPNQDTAMEVEETGSDETRPHNNNMEHSLDEEHCEKCDKDPVICPRCCLFVQRNNMQKHTYQSCPERTIYCKRCHSSFPCSMEETHKSQCPKMERECSDCGVNVLNENLQDHLDTECQKRVVICGACNSRMCYDERGDHDQECLEKPVVCDVCEGEMPRKEKSKHASECPMRVVCCKNCEGFYAYALKKHHQNECQRLPEVSKRGPIEKKSVPSVSLNVSAPPSPMGPQAASMKDHGPSSTKGSSDEEKQSCQFCGRPVKNCNYEKHLQVCWERKKECSHCSLPFFREEWKTHEDMCEKNPVNIKREPAPSVSEPWKMSQREQSRNEQAKPVKRIQELEIRQHKADRYRIDLEDGAKVHKTVP